ncbi:glycosyltransferase family 4 protein [Nostoc spongiaeforme FACHB-130]|uniref:Glycosyltransferase family 4 protein n=1 Tax=Nostoc spongiaeforme FACHB-130 TaxID=1357510 RepID=A0ABR8FUR0_9NOSO|nr:glycosyltransferase family 4 protein [Nostoc spongiaeforme]MBD2593982.1 glycosyltransferase family 4 protein [Nostoc spongiaeforme FACHB-130]
MKVTFCTYDDPNFTGGPNSWLRQLLPILQKHNVEINVLFFTYPEKLDNCPCYQDLYQQGIKCFVYKWISSTEQKIRWILQNLFEHPTDIFVPNIIIPAYLASRWIKEAGISTIGVLHADDEIYRGIIRQFVYGRPEFQLSALVSVSEFLLASAQQTAKLTTSTFTSTQFQKIPCGTPISSNIASLSTDNLKLIYFGRLEETQKRISEVTFALCRAVKEIPGTEATIYGSGAAKPNVEKILAEYGKNVPIKLGGLIDNSQIIKVISQHHVMVLLSDYEGLPLALLEAMSCGLVPICLDIRSGIPELVEHEITGLMVSDRGDDFIKAVRQLKSQPELWKNLSLAARQKIETAYSTELCALQWIDLFTQLYEQKKANQKILSIPKRLDLPPVDSGHSYFDCRQTEFMWKRMIEKNPISLLLNRKLGIRTSLKNLVRAKT